MWLEYVVIKRIHHLVIIILVTPPPPPQKEEKRITNGFDFLFAESTSPEQNKEQFSPDIRGSILETAFGKEAPCGTRRPTVILLVQTVDTTVDSQFTELEWNDRGTVEGRLSCGSWSQWQTIYWSFTEP